MDKSNAARKIQAKHIISRIGKKFHDGGFNCSATGLHLRHRSQRCGSAKPTKARWGWSQERCFIRGVTLHSFVIRMILPCTNFGGSHVEDIEHGRGGYRILQANFILNSISKTDRGKMLNINPPGAWNLESGAGQCSKQ